MVFVFWFVLSILAGIYANKLNRSGFGYFLLSLFLTPIIGFIALLVLGELKIKIPKTPKYFTDEELRQGKLCSSDDFITSDTIEFTEKYDVILAKVIDFYKNFNLKKTDGYGNGSEVYRNDEDSYFYIRKQDSRVILQIFKLPKFEIQNEKTFSSSNIDDLLKLSQLLEKELITKEEFEAQKIKLLNS